MYERVQTNRENWTLVSLCICLFLVGINSTAVNSVLVSIGEDVHANLSGMQWIVNSYQIALLMFVVLGGRIGDRYGRRTYFIRGMLVFALGSSVVALSYSTEVAIAGRLIQAIGAAFCMPATTTIIRIVIPQKRHGMAFAMWGAVAALSIAVGPLLGGALSVWVGWRWLFWLNIPLVLLACLIALLAMPESRDENSTARTDFSGVMTFSFGAFLLILGLDLIHSNSGAGIWTALVIGLSVLLLAVFFWVELYSRAPFIHLRFFKSPKFAVGFFSLFALTWTYSVLFFLANVLLQNPWIWKYDPLSSSIILLPLTAPFFVSSLFEKWLSAHYRPSRILVGGFLLIAAGALGMAAVGQDFDQVATLVLMAVFGLGAGVIMAPAMALVVETVPLQQAGEASGLGNVARYMGAGFGIAVSILIYRFSATSVFGRGLKQAHIDGLSFTAMDHLLSSTKRPPSAMLLPFPGGLGQATVLAHDALMSGVAWTMVVIGLLALTAAALCYRVANGRKAAS